MELIVFTQIKEEAKESGKTGFVDFKRVVWHECFKKMLETLKYSEAEGGFWVIAVMDSPDYFVHSLSFYQLILKNSMFTHSSQCHLNYRTVMIFN